MTIAELERACSSALRVKKREHEEKASFDYILADLIGRSIARIYNSANKMPAIEEVYPSLFESQELQEKKQEQKDQLSALRFKQYADFHNKKFNKEVANVK